MGERLFGQGAESDLGANFKNKNNKCHTGKFFPKITKLLPKLITKTLLFLLLKLAADYDWACKWTRVLIRTWTLTRFFFPKNRALIWTVRLTELCALNQSFTIVLFLISEVLFLFTTGIEYSCTMLRPREEYFQFCTLLNQSDCRDFVL